MRLVIPLESNRFNVVHVVHVGDSESHAAKRLGRIRVGRPARGATAG